MTNPQNTYDAYIGADAIGRFLKAHSDDDIPIPNRYTLKDEYDARFYKLYRILADTGYKSSYTKAEEASVEAMAVLDFCEGISITANFTVSVKEELLCAARKVVTQCASALIPRSTL
jgi:hypothetical protein